MFWDPRFYLQVCMAAASLFAIRRYAVYLRAELAARERGKPSREMPKPLQVLLGVSIVYFWYVMPFLPQPLLGNFSAAAPDLLPHTTVRWVQWGMGLSLGMAGTVLYVRLTRANLAVTAQDYCRPAVLLTDGPYSKIRHPIVATRFVAVAGVVLFTGAAYTAMLLPVLALELALSAHIEEKEVLIPVFRKEYRAYQGKVPGFLCGPMWLALLILALGLALSAVGTFPTEALSQSGFLQRSESAPF